MKPPGVVNCTDLATFQDFIKTISSWLGRRKMAFSKKESTLPSFNAFTYLITGNSRAYFIAP